MPRLREIRLREGVLEERISTSRPQNIEALLGYSRGEVAHQACDQCAASLKPFAHCVIVNGFFQNSCSGCHYNSTGILLLIRPVHAFLQHLSTYNTP